MRRPSSLARATRVLAPRSAALRRSVLASASTAPTVGADRGAGLAPPTVAETKRKFLSLFARPVNPMYSVVVNELIVTHHLWRHRVSYQYDPVFALGIVSVLDAVLSALPEAERASVFDAYIGALDEDPARYRADADALAAWARAAGADGIAPDAASPEAGPRALADLAARGALPDASAVVGGFAYTRAHAVGAFRLLELAGATSPDALKALVSALGWKQAAVTSDLNQYKSVLSKLTAAQELMEEFLAREKRKTAERLAAKEAKAAAAGAGAAGAAEGNKDKETASA